MLNVLWWVPFMHITFALFVLGWISHWENAEGAFGIGGEYRSKYSAYFRRKYHLWCKYPTGMRKTPSRNKTCSSRQKVILICVEFGENAPKNLIRRDVVHLFKSLKTKNHKLHAVECIALHRHTNRRRESKKTFLSHTHSIWQIQSIWNQIYFSNSTSNNKRKWENPFQNWILSTSDK